MSLEEPRLDPSCFSRLRERLVDEDTARRFFDAVVARARRQGLLSSDHFTVDGTLIEAWASAKSFKPKDGPPPPSDGQGGVNFRGKPRTNDTHESTTDAEAKLMRKGPGKEARLSYAGHAIMENRNGLCVDLQVRSVIETEPKAARALLGRQRRKHVRPKTSVATRATTRATSLRSCVIAASLRTSRRSRGARLPGSMRVRRAMRGTGLASASANGLKRSSAGSRVTADCARRASSAPLAFS
jgi:hypothetical protein